MIARPPNTTPVHASCMMQLVLIFWRPGKFPGLLFWGNVRQLSHIILFEQDQATGMTKGPVPDHSEAKGVNT